MNYIFNVFTNNRRMLLKKYIGKITGFISGLLLAFVAISFVPHLHPEEDFAGVTIFTLLLSGLLFSYFGSIIQNFLKK